MPLLEREVQLDALDGYAAEARAGGGRLVLVNGEAGVGKSALLEECERRHPGGRWAWGACDGLFTPRPLGPLLDIASRLGGALKETIDRGSTREEIFQALLSAVASGPAPTTLVFEDVHWADEATLDLLRFVGRRMRHLPVLLLVSYRDEEVPPGHPLRRCLAQLATDRSTRRIDVPRLTAAGVRRLAAGSGIDPGELHHLTSGNPFFLTEVLRDPGSHLPASAREAVLGRVDGLSRPARRALDVAALLGSRVDLSLLASIADPAPETVDELVESGLLVPDGAQLRFRHEITRRTVEDRLPPHRSAPLHGRILTMLRASESEDDARLAYHAEGASDASAAQAHATLAAHRAAAMASHREAATQFERALRWAGAGDVRSRALLLDGLATEYGVLDRWEEALETRESALEAWRWLGDEVREGDALRLLTTAHWRLCQGTMAAERSREAVALLEEHGPGEELARALAGEASLHSMAGDNEEALRLAERALGLAEALGVPDLVSHLLNTMACAQHDTGGPWREGLQRALEVAIDHHADEAAGRAYANLQAMAIGSLDFALAAQAHREGMEFCEAHDLPTYTNCLVGGHVTLLDATGAWDEAVHLGRTRIAVANLSPVNRLSTEITLGRILARRGDPAGWGHLDTALVDGAALAEGRYLIDIHLARAEAHWLEGDTEAAARSCCAAREHADRVDGASRGALATWLARLGLEPVSGPVEAPYAAELRGDTATAVRLWEEAGCPYDAAMALLDSTDEVHWREALSRFDALGAQATARLARRKLRDAGVRAVHTGPRSATRAHPCGLTPREQEVLDLLAVGLSDQQIADHLVLSPKTVHHHVSAVLGKLGVPNRHEARAEAERRGLVDARLTTR